MRVCIDFDNTITNGHYPDTGSPKHGVQEALNALKIAGFYITVYSCRTGDELFPNAFDRIKQVKIIEEYLRDNNIIFDEVYEGIGKPIADWYIDDKGIEFKDNWKEVTDRLLK